MKVGDFYRNKWNHWVAKITDVKRDKVELVIVNSGVKDIIAIENFDLNYEPCITIYQWRNTIEDLFSFATVIFVGDTIRIKKGSTLIDFSVSFKNQLAVSFTDDMKKSLGADTNILRFLLEDADKVVRLFAELFEE